MSIGVTKLVPVLNAVPPAAAANQLSVPVPDAVSVTVPASHVVAIADVAVGAAGTLLIVATTSAREVERHPLAAASTK